MLVGRVLHTLLLARLFLPGACPTRRENHVVCVPDSVRTCKMWLLMLIQAGGKVVLLNCNAAGLTVIAQSELPTCWFSVLR